MSEADILADCIKDMLGKLYSEEEYLKAAKWVNRLHELAEQKQQTPPGCLGEKDPEEHK